MPKRERKEEGGGGSRSSSGSSKRHQPEDESAATAVRFDERRCRWLTDCEVPRHSAEQDGGGGGGGGGGCVVYWMSRDQRVDDNWALLKAQALAAELGLPLRVCFVLAPKFLEATLRM